MIYVIRRKIDDLYLSNQGWVESLSQNCWFSKDYIKMFKENHLNEIDKYLIYTILNPIEKD